MPNKPKIYLDNCCFNRPFDDQKQLVIRLETEAVLFIQEEIKNGKLEFAWSYILEQENEDNPFERRRESIGLWKLRANTEINESEEVIQLAESYCQRGLKPKDALHVASAVVAKVDYFITTDRGILKKTIKQIQIVNPVQFIQINAEQKEL
jgi:predicted nucleic acid-binding protein